MNMFWDTLITQGCQSNQQFIYHEFDILQEQWRSIETPSWKKQLCVDVIETLCWRRRKGRSMSMPPSWTIHHTSMWPSVKRSPFDGYAEMFFGTSRAKLAAVVSRTTSVNKHFEWLFFYCGVNLYLPHVLYHCFKLTVHNQSVIISSKTTLPQKS